MEKSALGRLGDAHPPAFTLFTITYKVAVYAPAERTFISFLPLYVLCGHLHQQIFSLPEGFLGVEISTQQLKVDMGLAVLIISLSAFESKIVLTLLTLYFYKSTSFPHRNNKEKCIERRKT
jgi:hypothetical protein